MKPASFTLSALCAVGLATPALADPAADDRCEIKVDGDLTATSVSSGGAMSVGSDYWWSKDALRKSIPEKDPAKLEAALKKDPVHYILLLNCGKRGEAWVSLSPNASAKYADVPFKPGKYAVKMGGSGSDFTSMIKVGEVFMNGGGTIDITKFDAAGIAGTFELAADGTDRKTKTKKSVKLHGAFTLKCTAPGCGK